MQVIVFFTSAASREDGAHSLQSTPIGYDQMLTNGIPQPSMNIDMSMIRVLSRHDPADHFYSDLVACYEEIYFLTYSELSILIDRQIPKDASAKCAHRRAFEYNTSPGHVQEYCSTERA